MAWSTSRVFPETIRRADAKGLRVACLPAWYDIDTSDDLARLRMALAASDGDSPRHTRAFYLERQGGEGSRRSPGRRHPRDPATVIADSAYGRPPRRLPMHAPRVTVP